MTKQSRTDKIIFKIKDHKIAAIVIVTAIIILAVVGFYNATIASFFVNKSKSYVNDSLQHQTIKREKSSLDYIKDQFHPDTLISKKLISGMVARRNCELHFYVPNNWDLMEPIEGPAGFRYQTYSLPKNPLCRIGATTEIVCLEGLTDSSMIDILGSVDSQIQMNKRLSGFDENDPDNGYCNVNDYVQSQVDNLQATTEKFELLIYNECLKFLILDGSTYTQVESRRIKYSFELEGEKYTVMELIIYHEDVIYKLYFGAPFTEYIQLEDMFIDITTNCFLKQMF